mmetsp:Transcript_41857/g.78293  ORF Transcript_41857/g.78293 Transcript_41857/m.78293 type:complete len:123 (-) Transcript_41857:437-805(-)
MGQPSSGGQEYVQGVPVYGATNPQVTGGIPGTQPGFYSSTTVLVADMSLGEEPAEIFCTRCQQITQTKVTQEPGWLPWTICLTSCLCFMLPLCCVFCGPCLMDKTHTCGHCGAFVGRHPACT